MFVTRSLTVFNFWFVLFNAAFWSDESLLFVFNRCVVQNGYAAYTANAAITVINPTQITSSPVNYLQIQPGAIVTFACEAVGDPLLYTYITWYWTDIYSNVHVLDNSPPGKTLTTYYLSWSPVTFFVTVLLSFPIVRFSRFGSTDQVVSIQLYFFYYFVASNWSFYFI